MLPVKNIQVMVTCNDPGLVPDVLELYYVPDKPAVEILSGNRLCLPGERVLFTDAAVNRILFGRKCQLDSVRELRGTVLGLYDLADGNPAGISRISFLSEDAVFTMELRDDGSMSECAWHHIGPHWDFPGYKNPDGTRYRQPMYKDAPWTDTGDPWGFTAYSWEETH